VETIKHIGVLTGGGDCPGLNSVIRAVTKTAILDYNLDVIGFVDGFRGLVENNYMTLDLKTVSGIAHTGGTILGTTNRDNPFNFYSGGRTGQEPVDESDRAINNLQNLGLDAMVIIGGDGSLHIAHQFGQKRSPIDRGSQKPLITI
jgi:6-phosphofructokinase (EC 2.7.1.11)